MEMTHDPVLHAELRSCVRTFKNAGVLTMARAMQVSIEDFKRMLDTGMFRPEDIDRAKSLGLYDPPRAAPDTESIL